MRRIVPYLLIVLGAAVVSAGFNLFLIPHHLLSGGVSGISMLLGYAFDWNISLLYFAINLPILIWGLLAIGRSFVVLSIVSVLFTTWFLALIPVVRAADNPLLAAVAGGVVVGIGTGISFRAGGSTGGFDIIGSIVTRNRDFPLGTILFALNGLVVIAAGYPNQWDLALTSVLSIYITGKLVDSIHIRHLKVTAFIVTNEKEALLDRLLRNPRGVTVLRTTGGFSHNERDMLMTVTTRYELAELRKAIREIDPGAFVNIVETVGVIGEFRKLR